MTLSSLSILLMHQPTGLCGQPNTEKILPNFKSFNQPCYSGYPIKRHIWQMNNVCKFHGQLLIITASSPLDSYDTPYLSNKSFLIYPIICVLHVGLRIQYVSEHFQGKVFYFANYKNSIFLTSYLFEIAFSVFASQVAAVGTFGKIKSTPALKHLRLDF